MDDWPDSEDIAFRNNEAQYLMTYELHPEVRFPNCQDEDNKPVLVLLHGYGGSGMVFYKILAELHQRYKVYMVDLMGMGRSARPPFEADSPEEAEDFFINSLEHWREKLDLTEFILAGHSFGGYISA